MTVFKNPLWESLTAEQYERLCACCSRKEDIVPIARCFMTVKKQDAAEALASALDHLDCNSQVFDLSREEYDECLNQLTSTVTKRFYEHNDIVKDRPSIFLAGPTLRNDFFENSWRKDAVEILEKEGFDGAVYIPESMTGDYSAINLDDKGYPQWEWNRLETCDVILFWVPRNLETLPGFTTNVEFGRYITLCPEKVVLGYPVDAPKCTYLGTLYERFNNDGVANSLEDTLKHAIARINVLKEGH